MKYLIINFFLKAILPKTENITKAHLYDILRLFLGDGLLTSNG